jgi:hypothetical protein
MKSKATIQLENMLEYSHAMNYYGAVAVGEAISEIIIKMASDEAVKNAEPNYSRPERFLSDAKDAIKAERRDVQRLEDSAIKVDPSLIDKA